VTGKMNTALAGVGTMPTQTFILYAPTHRQACNINIKENPPPPSNKTKKHL
jgi:hypothetical protein